MQVLEDEEVVTQDKSGWPQSDVMQPLSAEPVCVMMPGKSIVLVAWPEAVQEKAWQGRTQLGYKMISLFYSVSKEDRVQHSFGSTLLWPLFYLELRWWEAML